jgi:hypothetical protein
MTVKQSRSTTFSSGKTKLPHAYSSLRARGAPEIWQRTSHVVLDLQAQINAEQVEEEEDNDAKSLILLS